MAFCLLVESRILKVGDEGGRDRGSIDRNGGKSVTSCCINSKFSPSCQAVKFAIVVDIGRNMITSGGYIL